MRLVWGDDLDDALRPFSASRSSSTAAGFGDVELHGDLGDRGARREGRASRSRCSLGAVLAARAASSAATSPTGSAAPA
jgi:hypothetical protein